MVEVDTSCLHCVAHTSLLIALGVIKPETSWFLPKAGPVFLDPHSDREFHGDHHSAMEHEQGDYTETPTNDISSSTLQAVSQEDHMLWVIIL